MNFALKALSARFFASLRSSCAYRTAIISQDGGVFHEPHDFVIQVDDNGNLLDKAAAARALETIRFSAEKHNTIVLIYVHGWHHNADIDDTNAHDFSRSLAKTRAVLDDAPLGINGPYTQSRKNLTDSDDVKVIGVYVGWRGRSLPMPFNFGTFWGRKRAAERVGEGELNHFLLALNDVYRDRTLARRSDGKASFMGMVTFGHSFGGQVVFKAVAETIEKELASSKPGPLQGFGDLTILVNPALEAAQYDAIHKKAAERTYQNTQAPVMMVISSQGDWANRWVFPIGRLLGSTVKRKPEDTRWEQWNKALGDYKPHRTHVMSVNTEATTTTPPFNAADYVNNPCVISQYDLSAEKDYGNVKFVPLQPHRPFNPFIVAYTDNKLVIGHSRVFENSLHGFINDFVALTQGKKMVVGGEKPPC